MAVMLAVAHESRPRPGEQVNGDEVWVRAYGDAITFAVIDGTGHGPEAANAAARAVSVLEASPFGTPIEDLFSAMHDELRGSRGAAATVCRFAGRSLVGAGVGNVEVRALGRSIPALLTPGIIGHRIHRLRTFEVPLEIGDRIVLYSDGISSRALYSLSPEPNPERACAALLEQGARTTDDATALIADVVRVVSKTKDGHG